MFQVSEFYEADFINYFLMSILTELHEAIQRLIFRVNQFDGFGETSVRLGKIMYYCQDY